MSPDADCLPPGVTRKRYYNPVLDLRPQQLKMSAKWVETVNSGKYKSGGPLNEPDDDHPYNLVSSLCTDGLHRPALDLDTPTPEVLAFVDGLAARVDRGVVLVPSSTEGHLHAYIPNLALTWEQYAGLLVVASQNKVIDPAYLGASIDRSQTLLRPPHVVKVAK